MCRFIHNRDIWQAPPSQDLVNYACPNCLPGYDIAMSGMVAKEELECRISLGMMGWMFVWLNGNDWMDVCVARREL